MSEPAIEQNYRAVRDRIASAAARAGREADSVLLVAVTKYASLEWMRRLHELGHRDFGESQRQQLEARAESFAELFPDDEPRWHMVGRLQRKKLKRLVRIARLIHSVDSIALAEALHGAGEGVELLVQVNASGEETKAGLPPAVVPHMVEQIHTLAHLRIRGLMTIAPYSENPEDARLTFARTAELFHEIRGRGVVSPEDFNILSMGMSGDLEVAVEEGANLVRVGSALWPDA